MELLVAMGQDNESPVAPRSGTRGWFRRALVLATIPAVIAASGYGGWRYLYPYGFSHCCDLQLGMALREYAESHDGNLPAGEVSPEGSLSLLYGAVPWVSANLLRGKIVPEEVVQARLDAGQLLTPETCGWHYVEGLRIDDDGSIAVCWDKVGLDHNGGRLPAGGHTVLYLNGMHRTIPAHAWPAFLDEQRDRIAKSKAARPRSRSAPATAKVGAKHG